MHRSTLAMLIVVPLAGCGSSNNSSAPSPVAATTPTPTPTPAPTPTPTPAVDVTGSWRSEARAWDFDLRQQGSTITGVLVGFRNTRYDPADPAVQITGSYTASTRRLTFGCPAWAISFDGIVESGNRMTGTLYDCGNACRNYGEVLVRQ